MNESPLVGPPFDLARNPRVVRAMKRPLPVQVRFAEADGCCDTREGPVAYLARDAILCGVEGESWPIPRGRFDTMYDPIPPLRQGIPGSYLRRPSLVLALQLEEQMQIQVGWRGDALRGEPGDWLVQYSPDDHAIVARTVFQKSYRISR